MGNKEPSDVLADYISEFGPNDGPIVNRLTNSVSQLALEWRIFLYFFCGPKERVDVLNSASGLTARLLKNLLWDNALLKVRKLTDPMSQKKNTNLSLEHLKRIAQARDGIDLSASFDLVGKSCATSRTYVDKMIAHSDLSHALGENEVVVVRRDTTAAIKEIIGFVQKFHEKVRDTHYMLLPLTSVNDEQQFLARIFLGNEAAVAQQAATLAKAKAGDWNSLHEPRLPSWLWDSNFRNSPF